MKITNVRSLEILDSRGNPTVRTYVTLEDGSIHVSSVPSGASTGSHEAVELRDGDKTRFLGNGVLKAVENVNTTISNAIVGMETDPNEVDNKLLEIDGTPNKANLGANAILSVSLAVCRAATHANGKKLWEFLNQYYFSRHPEPFGHSERSEESQGKLREGSQDSSASPKNDRTPSFPRLLVNIVNGGKHASWNFDIQEFMVVPNTTKPSDSIKIAAEIFHSLGKVLKQKGLSTLVGDEGGYSPASPSGSQGGPALNSNEEVLETIIEAAKQTGYENIRDFRLSLDCAATEWFENGTYVSHKTGSQLSVDDLISNYQLLTNNYQLLSLEDPFAEDDWEAWKKFVSVTASDSAAVSEIASSQAPRNDSLVIIGDDLFVTNPERIKRGIEEKAANSVLVKVNQIGTMKETAEAINMTHSAGWKTAISHRSGETEDTFIADLAYACSSEFLKTGSMSRSERLSKYNRLLEIENNL